MDESGNRCDLAVVVGSGRILGFAASFVAAAPMDFESTTLGFEDFDRPIVWREVSGFPISLEGLSFADFLDSLPGPPFPATAFRLEDFFKGRAAETRQSFRGLFKRSVVCFFDRGARSIA